MIEVKNLFAGYGDTEILHDVSFALNSGENLSIIGANGCGKTTLLRAMAGTLPYKGEVLLNGVNICTLKQKALAKKVAMLSQTTQIFFNYTVYETVMMGRYVHLKGGIFDSESKEDERIVLTALETVGLLSVKNKEINTLSGGQLQRVFIAKIFAQNPNVILLDEPTNHLDLKYQLELIEFLKQWANQEDKLIIGVLHDINLAMRLTENVLLMENGKVKAFGKNEEVYSSEALKQAYKMDIPKYMLENLSQWGKLIKPCD